VVDFIVMPYHFPPDIDERIRARMISRSLSSEDDVLREAMDALEQLEEEKSRRWHERNQIAIDQSRGGLSRPLDLEGVLERVEERVARNSQGE
jgi:Arc/MetJ-type ribon-helix-helix transcriptional regulator